MQWFLGGLSSIIFIIVLITFKIYVKPVKVAQFCYPSKVEDKAIWAHPTQLSSLARHCPPQIKKEYNRDVCVPMFVAAEFISPKSFKQPVAPSIDN